MKENGSNCPKDDASTSSSVSDRIGYKKFKTLLMSKNPTEWMDLAVEYKWVIMFMLCASKLILQVFSLHTLVTICCLIYSMNKMAVMKWEDMQVKGLAYYLPLGIKNALLNRSLLDILCDLWFIPTLSLYLKTILAPMISNKRRAPEDAVKYLDPLEPNHRKIFITKGLAFLLPKKITKLLLPRGYFQNPILNPQYGLGKSNFLSDDDKESSDNDADSTLLMLREAPSEQRDFEPGSPTRKTNFGKVIMSDPQTSNSPPESLVMSENRLIPLQKPNEVVQIIQMSKPPGGGVETIKRSKILMSSKMLKNLKTMPGRIDPSWDNIKEYERRRNLGTIPKSQSSDKLNLLKLLIDLKKFDFLKKANKSTILKVSGGSALFLLIQIVLFRKARKWTKSLLLLLTYTGGVTVLVSCIVWILIQSKFSVEDDDKTGKKHRTDSEEMLAIKAREKEIEESLQQTGSRSFIEEEDN